MINPHLALCSPHNLDSEGVGLLSPLEPPKSGKEDPGGARLWRGWRAALGPPSTPGKRGQPKLTTPELLGLCDYFTPKQLNSHHLRPGESAQQGALLPSPSTASSVAV